MLSDPSCYPFVQQLERHCPIIRAEVEQLPEHAWLPWPENAVGLRVLPLLMPYQPPWVDDRFDERRALCPRTWEWIQGQPQLFSAAISSLAPGGRILPHRDMEEPSALRCHLGLSLPEPGTATFRVGDDTVAWSQGRCLVFHACEDHEARNDGDAPRVILVVDARIDQGR